MVDAHFKLIDKNPESVEKSIDQRILEVTQINKKLVALSLTDPLLDIGNRRAMEVDLKHTTSISRRYQRPCSVALFDIDYFKRYNDVYGHQAGDEALQIICKLLKKSKREADRLYRYGGEEILLLMPENAVTDAEQVASRMQRTVEKANIPHSAAQQKILTVSGGIGTMDITDSKSGPWEQLIEQADNGLYEAKSKGRNQVVAGKILVNTS